jgi:putative transposase
MICISAPPKFCIAMAIGFLRAKAPYGLHKKLAGRKPKGFTNKNLWTRGYCVSTVRLDEKTVREYIQNQETLDRALQGSLTFEENIDF